MQERATWLSHHPSEHHDRCVVVGGRHVCRRCAVLYPVAVLTAALVALSTSESAALVWAMWLLPVPAALEWTAEHLGGAAHHPGRLAALSVPAGVALGIGVGLQVHDPWALSTVAPLVTWAVALGVIALIGSTRGAPGRPDWEDQHDRSERARDAALRARLAESDAHRAEG